MSDQAAEAVTVAAEPPTVEDLQAEIDDLESQLDFAEDELRELRAAVTDTLWWIRYRLKQGDTEYALDLIERWPDVGRG